jgi:hypothetical protein
MPYPLEDDGVIPYPFEADGVMLLVLAMPLDLFIMARRAALRRRWFTAAS